MPCAQPTKCGDINGDNVVNILDIVQMVNIILGNLDEADVECYCAADYTGDGSLNVLDIVNTVNTVLGNVTHTDCSQQCGTAELGIGTLSIYHAYPPGGNNYSVQYTSTLPVKTFQFGVVGEDVYDSTGLSDLLYDNDFEVTRTSSTYGSYNMSIFYGQSGTGQYLPDTADEEYMLQITGDTSPLCLTEAMFTDSWDNIINIDVGEMDCGFVLNTPPVAIITA